jgi:topoisomerase IV subunit A
MSNIQTLPLEDIMGDRFGRYSKYIIQERALPDIRDGFKTGTTPYSLFNE